MSTSTCLYTYTYIHTFIHIYTLIHIYTSLYGLIYWPTHPLQTYWLILVVIRTDWTSATGSGTDWRRVGALLCISAAWIRRYRDLADVALLNPKHPCSSTLRVQSTQISGIYGFYTRNRSSGFGNILCIWVLGPLGVCICLELELAPMSLD